MNDRIIIADASKASPHDFARSIGIRIRTSEEKAAEWRAMCERAADAIENGLEALVSPPCLADARAIVAERAMLTECNPDPLKHLEPKRKAA